jgi:hypothetical protein
MKTKLFVLALIVLLAGSLLTNFLFLEQIHALKESVTEQNLKYNSLVTFNASWEETRRFNEEHIFLEDSHHYIESGVIAFGDDVKVHKTYDILVGTKRETRYVYVFDSSAGFYYQGKWFPIDARKGDTINLMSAQDAVGPKSIGYYLCNTNSRYCEAHVVNTGIPSGE